MKRTIATVVAVIAMSTALASPASASTTYTKAWPTPNLSAGFIPQGMTPYGNRVLMAEYKLGSNTRLVELDNKGKVLGWVSIAPTHAGGIAIVGNWLYVQNADTPNHDTVRAYKVSDLHFTKHPTYAKANHLQELKPWQFASFMTADGGQLLSGHHGVGQSSLMYRFNVDQKTGLLTAVSHVTVPNNTQGVAAGGTVFTSGGGHLVVNGVDRKIPSHAEGVIVIGKTAYIAFEGGAKYVLKINL